MLRDIAARVEDHVRRAGPLLSAISDAAASEPRPAGGWSIKQILGHLIDSASNNHQRFVRLQQVETLRLSGYEQDFWVDIQGYNERPLTDLVALWSSYNRHLAHVIRRIDPATLARTVELSPGEQQNLEFFVRDYELHLARHLEQIGL